MIYDKLNWKEHIKITQYNIYKAIAIIYKASHRVRIYYTSFFDLNFVVIFRIQLYVLKKSVTYL